MSSSQSYKIADSLYLNRHTVVAGSKPATPVEVPVNHIVVADCSGSMSWDLPKVREQLKKKLPKLLGPQDTFSCIWFSGKGQYGVLLEAEPVSTLTDLAQVSKAIDQWLRPVGMTGFKEPLEAVSTLIDKVGKSNKNPFSLMFFSDGCDNQWRRDDILKAMSLSDGKLASATFVEYGYYADRPLLSALAEKAGGSLIFAENFDRFVPSFEAALQKKASGAKRIEVDLQADPIGGFAFALVGGDLVTFAVTGSKVSVPADLADVAYLATTPKGDTSGPNGPVDLGTVAALYAKGGKVEDHFALSAAYAATSLFGIRQKPDIVLPLLKATGDVLFIEQFANSFGKQKSNAFTDDVKGAAFNPSKRLTKGYDPNKVPREDAFTVLDVLSTLQEEDENRVLLGHEAFVYKRIGRERLDASDMLTDEERAQIESLTDQMKSVKDSKKIKELTEKIAAVTANKLEPLKFVENEEAKKAGYPINTLTFAQDRPNVSIQVTRVGSVDISARLPAEYKGAALGKVPETFPTTIIRAYAVIKDGLVNVETLPTRLCAATKKRFAEEIKSGRLTPDFLKEDGDVTLLNLKALPVVNRKMVKAVSAKSFFETQFALTKAQASQKVYNSYSKELLSDKKSQTFEALYGADASVWLKDNGFNDYGFSPTSTTQAEPTDVYNAKQLKVSIKGYSTIPSLNEFRKQATKGKYNGPGELMRAAAEEVEAFLASDFYKKAGDQTAVLEAWLRDRQRQATSEVRKNLFAVAQATFSIVVGQVWFTEFSSLDENSMTLDVGNGLSLAFTVEQNEVPVKV